MPNFQNSNFGSFGRADKNPYSHDRRADKDSYPILVRGKPSPVPVLRQCSYLGIDWYSHPIPIKGSVQANENGPILDREISRDFIINS